MWGTESVVTPRKRGKEYIQTVFRNKSRLCFGINPGVLDHEYTPFYLTNIRLHLKGIISENSAI